VVPDKKSFPPRALIVIGLTILSFLVAVFWVVLRQGVARSFDLPDNQQRLEAMKERWKEKRDTP
jgi:hypothetical protein